MPRFCVMDFETASFTDLKKSGAWKYAECPTTEILCISYFAEGANHPGLRLPDDLRYDAADDKTLERCVDDPECFFIAHNAAFERAIWRFIMMRVYGWPDIPDERWHDTQAVCAMKALPLKLERAALALRLPIQKDMSGSKFTVQLSKPNKRGFLDRSPQSLLRVGEYCKMDVLTELELHRTIRGLGNSERKVWLLDQKINQRGLMLDMNFVDAAETVVQLASIPLRREFLQITGGIEPTQRDKFLEWLRANGAKLPDLKKDTIDKFLGDGEDDDEDSLAGDEDDWLEEKPQLRLPFTHERALRIRKTLGSASIKKLAAMRNCVGSDGRAHGVLQYHGAGPGRWAGRLLQPQNFPRGVTRVGGEAPDPEQLVEAILSRDHEWVDTLFGNPIEAVASSLRHAIIAAPGHKLLAGDFARIEAVIVLALAGASRALEMFTDKNRDPYIEMACSIFDLPVPRDKEGLKLFKKLHLEKRQTGKNTILGCGFQMGWRKFRMRYAEDKPPEFAQRCIKAYREDMAPEVTQLWYGLERASTRAVWDRRPTEAYGVTYEIVDRWLTARLPSGRRLWYYDPKPIKKAMPWDKDDIRPGWQYWTWKAGRWICRTAYGGLLTENAVQALARDLLVEAMFKAEQNDIPVVLTVHDELVGEPEESRADPATLDKIMCDIPGWAHALNIPVSAECWAADRYRK